MARSHAQGRESFQTLVVGVDPGMRPGVAIIGDGRVLVAETVGSPERVADEIARFRRCFRHDRLIARVGHGDRTNRNRIIRSIWNSVDDIEVVDETNTTRRTEEPDADAAVSIALGYGVPPAVPPGGAAHPGRGQGHPAAQSHRERGAGDHLVGPGRGGGQGRAYSP